MIALLSRIRWVVGACALLLAAGCGDGGSGGGPGSDADSDSDADTDTDSDSDADTDTDTDGDAGPDGSADSDTDADGDLLEAEVECDPTGDPCDLPAPDTGVYATLRKDFFYPYDEYAETGPDPIDGGRFQIAGVAAASGAIADLRIDGVSAAELVTTASGGPYVEWYHVWPDPAVAGEPIWVAFHSRSASWNSAPSGHLEVEVEGAALAIDADFPVATTPVPLTYVTVSDDLGELVVHVANTDSVPHEASRVLVNGRDVLAADVACIPDTALAPGSSQMWTVPLCEPAALGDPWTVVVELDGESETVGAGRVLRPHFPIETWPSGGDDPFPGCDETILGDHLAAGFDTFYMYWSESCGAGGQEIVNTLGPATDGFNALVGDDFFGAFLGDPDAGSLITDLAAVAGFLTGDESDMEIYEDDGAPHPESKAADARWLWSIYPETLAYNGGATNRNVGTIAGATDVQGLDFYVAGCAPHITAYLEQPPLRGAYDYLANAKRNHMPGTNWFYAQGLHDGSWTDQPNPAEVLVQAFSVMAGGGKGLMWFQTVAPLAASYPDSWQAISRSNWVFRGLRSRLREGDVTGLAATAGDAIVEAIRGRDAIVVPVINLATTSVPTMTSCSLAAIGFPTPHFALAEQIVDVDVTVPDDFGVGDVFEVLVDDGGAQVADPSCAVSAAGRVMTLGGLSLSHGVPVRVLVLARDASVRDDVEAAIAH